jgi:GH24 family phage-related lysozyme (muramidase)
MISDAIRLASDALVKPFEGYAKRLSDGGCRAYPDPATHGAPWTIGWGCTGADITPDTVWSQNKAQEELEKHLLYFTSKAIRMSPSLITSGDRRLAAIISFNYNCGLGRYRISTLKKRVDARDWEGACEEIVKWNKASGRVLVGLTRRRLAESALLS